MRGLAGYLPHTKCPRNACRINEGNSVGLEENAYPSQTILPLSLPFSHPPGAPSPQRQPLRMGSWNLDENPVGSAPRASQLHGDQARGRVLGVAETSVSPQSERGPGNSLSLLPGPADGGFGSVRSVQFNTSRLERWGHEAEGCPRPGPPGPTGRLCACSLNAMGLFPNTLLSNCRKRCPAPFAQFTTCTTIPCGPARGLSQGGERCD